MLRLVAQGLTDAQVAQQLIVSSRTITTNLGSNYNNLDVSFRAAATRFAIVHQLV
jgi:DNA-binding NarL/FixJ family response regulator